MARLDTTSVPKTLSKTVHSVDHRGLPPPQESPVPTECPLSPPAAASFVHGLIMVLLEHTHRG